MSSARGNASEKRQLGRDLRQFVEAQAAGAAA